MTTPDTPAEEPIKMVCVRCGSTNCCSFEVVRQGGDISVVLPAHKRDEKTQAAVLEQMRPPSNLFLKIGFIASWIVGLLTLPIGFNWSYERNGRLGGSLLLDFGYGFLFSLGVFITMIVVFLVLSRILGSKKWHEFMEQEWRRSFVCKDCGNVNFADYVGPLAGIK